VNRQRHEVAIVGGGIIGTATGMALTRKFRDSVCILEAEPRLAAHQTGHNSGVIHSGLYYKPGSLKAINCARGREAIYAFCAEHHIAHERCGKLVVASHQGEVSFLQELERRGIANGLREIRRLSAEEMIDHEPHVVGVAGLLVRETGIVDYVEVTEKFASLVRKHGGEIHRDCKVLAFKDTPSGMVLETTKGPVLCRNLINCAGLHSDRIAWMCGVDPGLRIVPFRGEYYKLIPEREHLVRNLIYPVPDPQLPFLGVHFTRMIRGGVEAGPNAVLAFKREGYSKWQMSLIDTAETFYYRGFWRLAVRYWKTGLAEMYRSFMKGAFVKALQKLVPEIQPHDVHPAGAGVRAQALEPDGFLVDDFRIVGADRMIHVLNVPSPGAASSISIGESIAQMAARQFDLKPANPNYS
jgi:L-2-hydroxyglutarate oxidase